MNKNKIKGRNRSGSNSHRRGATNHRGTATRMNNDTDCEPCDIDRSASFDDKSSSTFSNTMHNNSAVDDNAHVKGNRFTFHKKNSEESDKEISVGSTRNPKSIDMLQNLTSEGQFCKNFDCNTKQNVEVPKNLNSTDSSTGINTVRNLLAQAESIKQMLDPSAVINDCRTKVVAMTELCIGSHVEKIVSVSSQISKSDNKDKIILEKHLGNMKLQHKSFQQFVNQIYNDLSELCSQSDINVILKRTEEILSKVETECKRFGKTLPAYALKNDIEMELKEKQVAVVSCDAVYFGNTVIPLLIENMFDSGIIACCEVNDVLALSSAKNCASLTHQKLGTFVSCEVGKENITSKDTKILYTTVRELFSYSLKDPLFSRFSCIILNEFLQRSIQVDILLASLRECLVSRKDLKLVLFVSEEETALNIEKYFSKMSSSSLLCTENLILPVQVIWKEATCDSEEDFITEAANICLAIHVLNDEGDVLVFLPSGEDASQACMLTISKLQEFSLKNVECVHISEQMKVKKALQLVEQKRDVRNIIFTQDGFEALMFPNVRYVVDAGRIREVCYDPQKRLEVQKISFISQSRAKIRKNCAGRYVSGICYRMYSKENYIRNMACKEIPEILMRSPLNSLVEIFQYKPDTALTIEFIEPFSRQVKENALKSLKSLGALKNDKLTRLGELIIKLPFLPKYSKLIILGIQWGFPFEAVVVVALFLVKGYFFKYKNTEDFKKVIDAAKLHFIQSDSDTLTFLNIYKQWTENGFSEQWCDENCIEFTFLESVQTKVNEICEIVHKNVDASAVDKFSDDFKWSSLQEALFECFKDNLCVYTGHFLSGYRSVTGQCIVFLHPSTSIPRKENLPQFIVYDRCISKSRNFVTRITSVPEAVITEALKNGVLDAKQHDLFERKLVPCVIDYVGDMIIKHVLKKEKLKELEEQIRNKTKSELIVIEPSVEKGNVTLYALPGSIQKAEEEMRKIVQESIEHFRNERETSILEFHNGNSVAPVSISWSSGGKISSAIVGTRQNTCSTLQANFFDHPNVVNSEESTTHSCIRLSWLRRPCKGFGFVGFEPDDFSKARKLALKTVQVKGHDVDVQINKKKNCQLFVSDLHPETTVSDLKEAIEETLEKGICVSFANVILSSPFETSDGDIQEIETELKALCQDLLSTYILEVKVYKPKKEDIIMTAEVKVRSGSNLALQANILDSGLKFGNVSVKAKPVYYSNLFCNVQVLKALEPCIQDSLKKFEQDLSKSPEVDSGEDLFRLEADIYDNLTAKLKLSAYDEKNIADLRKIVQILLEGVVITPEDISCIHKLFCHGGHLWLETLEKSENIHIIDEHKSKTIRLYGSLDACRRAALRIEQFLNSVEEEAVKHIFLAEKDSRILLKAIIQEYGVDLKKFIASCGLRSAELDIRKCQLTLHGSATSIEMAGSELDKLAEHYNSKCVTEVQSQENCPVCLCPALTLTFRLENCGHLYCDACIKGLLNDVVIPLQCCAEGCGKEFILEDIRKVLEYDPSKINEFQKQSLKHYIAGNPNFVYCPSPDCSMFIDKEKIRGGKWNCPLCHNDICMPCNTIYHHGYSCEMYQGMKKDSDFSFKVWKKNKNCKFCPKCNNAIQKTEGCNHMVCCVCRAHFCWLCLRAFKTGNDVYNHLPFCPNNQARD